MAAQVEPLPLLRAPEGPTPTTPDQAYWRAFKNQIFLPSQHNVGVTSITVPDVNPSGAQADTFAVTTGNRIQIYGSKTRKSIKTIARFGPDDTARSGVLRRDGRILLAGGDSGVVQAFDTASRAILRQWNGVTSHKQAVHAVRWNPTLLTDLMTCSDDKTVRLWDLTDDAPKWVGNGHQDYVRSGGFLPGHGGNLIVSGSYDQTVRVWDTRQKGGVAAMIFNIKAPVEDVMAMNNSYIACAAANQVSIVNLMAGKAEQIIRSHQKTVTSLAMAQGGSRLLTGALDGHVKIHDTKGWSLVTGFKYEHPVLSLAVVPAPGGISSTPDDRHLAVGLESGLLSIRTRLAGVEKAKAREKEKRMEALVAGTADEYERKQKKKDMRQGIRARDRGKDYKGEGAALVADGNVEPRVGKIQPWQRHIMKYRFAQALDEVLPPTDWKASYHSEQVLTLLHELSRRGSLRTALANRQEDRLLPILGFTWRYLNNPRYSRVLYEVMMIVLELYSHQMDEWDLDGGVGKELRALMGKINKRVKQAVESAQQAHCTLGMMELLKAG